MTARRPTLSPAAYLNVQVPRFRRAGARPVEAPAPWIPHGERGEHSEIEDTLPLPRCAECLDRIFYETWGWHHTEMVLDGDHEARPEIASKKSLDSPLNK